ncbi:MAG: hypothetical protein ACRD3V_21165, partial [Vicinamibacteria bacterium]
MFPATKEKGRRASPSKPQSHARERDRKLGTRLVPPLPLAESRGSFGLVWTDRRIAAAVVVGVTALSGSLLAFVMPRGPITTAQALAAMAVGLLVGVTGGFMLRSRWA